MSKIFYDTKFLEDGKTIDLISIGMVSDDGREYYAICDNPGTIYRAQQHEWLRENVLSSLPLRSDWYYEPWDYSHPDYSAVKHPEVIADEVRDFILAVPDPQLWAWYASTDFVALYQLWGPLTERPKGIPMRTNDLKQECMRLGNPKMPAQESGEHNALADARHVKAMAAFLGTLNGERQ